MFQPAYRIVWTISLCVLGLGQLAHAQVPVPNSSFEDGGESPAAWTLTGGQGGLLSPGAAGDRAISVTGDGQSNSAWLSPPLDLEPDTVYRLRFQARRVQGTTGLPTSGPLFCNSDLTSLGSEWTACESFFVTPQQLSADIARLRFGQWEVNGTVAYDDVRVEPIIPVYQAHGALRLGEGERLTGNQYTFEAPFGKASANQARPLAWHRCMFNTNRWLMDESAAVVYRHDLGRMQQRAQVHATIGWYQHGELVVSASRDGQQWEEIGSLGQRGSVACEVPATLLPAEQIWVKFSVRRATGDTSPPSLQLFRYRYESTVDGPPLDLVGATHFVAVLKSDPQLQVSITDLGEAVPGGDNKVTLSLRNRANKKLRLEAGGQRVDLPAGDADQPVTIPYTLAGSGKHVVAIRIGGDVEFAAEATVTISPLHETSYGQVLPASSAEVGLWWCSSGWKISSRRPVPGPNTQSAAIEVAAAANEAEAVQLVVRPARPLAGLTVTAGTLTGPAGAKIGAEQIDILRVRYVSVVQPTDASATAGLWPDPLPPLAGPVTAEADQNLPLWVRVRVPRDQPAGSYLGTLVLAAEDYRAEVPLQVEVFGFNLPDRMTCQTAFGFDPGEAWRYHGVTTDADRRQVLASYLQCLADHHISPYNPAPLDGIQVTWTNLPPWVGGETDTEVVHAGTTSLRVADDSPTAAASAVFRTRIPIADQGIKLSFWYRTHQPGHRFLVTLAHHDASGHWMSGRNNDLLVTGDGTWQHYEQTVTQFPAGAKSLTITLRATEWREDGSLTGSVWFDDVSLIDVASGTEQLIDGGFEAVAQQIPEPVFDFSAWDTAMHQAMEGYHFNTFQLHVPGLGSGTFHARAEPELLGYAEHTPQYQGAMRAFLEKLQAHLRDRGWLDEAFVYWFDEPDPKDYDFVMNGFTKLKTWAPDIRRMLTEQVEQALVGGPNIWCPLTPAYDAEQAAPRRAAGDTFWWYVCTVPKAPYCTLFIDHPGTELRVWLWQTWQHDIAGVLVWQTNYWTSAAAYPDAAHPQNPYADPMGWVSGYSTPAGVRQAWGNGDGRFLYPPERAADGRPAAPVLDPAVASIRLEMLRDGLEDYEYLALLQRLVAARQDTLTSQQLAEYSALLKVPADITSDLTTFTCDPAPIEQRREEIARAIERLQ